MIFVDVLHFKDLDPVFFWFRIRVVEKSRIRNTAVKIDR